MRKEVDIAIIGRGPAGISAALYTCRANRKTIVIAKGTGALAGAEKIDNYYGVGSISGEALARTGREQAEALGAAFLDSEVLHIDYMGQFIISTTDGEVAAKAVLLATGAARKAPKIPGLLEFEGKGVSYCAICDGFFFKGKNVAVIGNKRYALSEAADLLPLAAQVHILTDGKPMQAETDEKIIIDTRKITGIHGESRVQSVSFDTGEPLALDGVFIALETATSTDFARKLGAAINKTKITVDGAFMTNIPGLFAAGDCVSDVMQVSIAVGQGAAAGMNIVKFLRDTEEKKNG